MTEIQVLRAADRVASPWKNGGGVTREVASSPSPGTTDAAAGAFDWRVSLADVADGGPFSVFEGIDRIITVVRGEGMALTVDGVETVVAERFVPFAFSGDATTDCRLLGGPLVDFNVMTRRGAVTAEVTMCTDSMDVTGPALVVVLTGKGWVDEIPLGVLDAARVDQGTVLVGSKGVTAVVEFR